MTAVITAVLTSPHSNSSPDIDNEREGAGEGGLYLKVDTQAVTSVGKKCDCFWWRVFTPEYSRNICCELVVIVGFTETTVCLVRESGGGGDHWKRNAQMVLSLPLNVPPC